MGDRRYDKPLDQLLDLMAESWPAEGEHLRNAAGSVRRLFANRDETPRIMVTAGWDVDPVVAEVENIRDDLSQMRDAMYAARTRLDDILRLLRDRLHEPATTAPTAGAAA